MLKQDVKILSIPKKEQTEHVLIECGTVYSFPIHGHSYYEILVYEAFSGEITVNGSRFQTDIPTAVLITPNDFHSISVQFPSKVTYHKLMIPSSVMDGFSERSFSSAVIQSHEKVAFLKGLCEEAYQCRDDLRYLSVCANTVALTLQKTGNELPPINKSVSLIREATEIIHLRFAEPITLQSVAKELHVTPQYLSNLFSKYAKTSFVNYLTDRRLRIAAMELQNGSNVTEACFRSGYRNLSHFIRSFQKKYGVTPSRYLPAPSTKKEHDSI